MSDPTTRPPAIPLHALPSSLPPLHNVIQPARSSIQKSRATSSRPRVAQVTLSTQHATAQIEDERFSSSEEDTETPRHVRSTTRGASVAPLQGRNEELEELTSLQPGSAEAVQRLHNIASVDKITPEGNYSLCRDLELLVAVFQHFWTAGLGMFLFFVQVHMFIIVPTSS